MAAITGYSYRKVHLSLKVATEALYKLAVKHFEKMTLDFIRKNTTEYSKKVLGISTKVKDPILTVVDSVGFEINKPSMSNII